MLKHSSGARALFALLAGLACAAAGPPAMPMAGATAAPAGAGSNLGPYNVRVLEGSIGLHSPSRCGRIPAVCRCAVVARRMAE